MCGIAGFCSDQVSYDQEKEKWKTILQNMNQVQKRRGPDEEGMVPFQSLRHGTCEIVGD